MGASAVLKLQKVGFTIEQVEALADFMDTQAASKADLERGIATVRTEIAETKAELKGDIAAVRSDLEAATHRLDSTIAEVRSDLRLVETNLRGQIAEAESRMTIKLGGMLVVITGILLAAIRYLPPH